MKPEPTMGDLIGRVLFGFDNMREPAQIGSYALSVQASRGHYCSPQESDLPMSAYTLVEVAILGRAGHPINPRTLPGFSPMLASLFEDGPIPVAGYVSWENVHLMRAELERLAQEGA